MVGCKQSRRSDPMQRSSETIMSMRMIDDKETGMDKWVGEGRADGGGRGPHG